MGSTASRSSCVSSKEKPYLLQRKLVERPWGGEIWFTAEEELPLLFKFIYTHQALSFQVHPGDLYAAEHHNSRGKTEMWYIASAAPDAKIALGFREPVTRQRLRVAAMSGEIQDLLNWVAPRPRDAFFVPAGTVHAIGAGIELWEVQENSDVTYRLFDYGRGRQLHLDQALDVINMEQSDPGPVRLPVCCEWFCTDRMESEGSIDLAPDGERWHALICVKGRGAIQGEAFEEGQVWLLPPGEVALKLNCEAHCELLHSWAP